MSRAAPRGGPGRMPRQGRIRPGGVLFLLAAPLLSCGPPPPPPFDADAELRTELGLAPDVPIHRITLGGRGAEDHVVPLTLDIGPRDIVNFLSADTRVQVIRFDGEELSPAGRAFLDGTAQRVSPPLTDPGSRWVLSFIDAPPGEYPFVVEGHGSPVSGVIQVRRR